MLDDCEEIADFLQSFLPRPMTDDSDDLGRWMIMDPEGNPWPITEVDLFPRWEQSLRSLKQMVMHNK